MQIGGNLILVLGLAAAPAFADTYVELKPVVDGTCIRCHNPRGAAGFLPLTTLDEIKPNRELMLELVGAGEMPMGNPAWKDGADGQRLLNWLRTGTDVLPTPQCEDPPPEPLIVRDPRTLRYADVKALIDRHCTGCHGPSGQMARKPLTTLAEIRRRARDAWEQLDEGRMPRSNPELAYTADGRVIAQWLRYGEDVTWRGTGGGGDDDDVPVGDDD